MDAFAESEFEDQVFSRQDIFSADLQDKIFEKCKFNHCTFLDCDFSGVEFADCSFENCSVGPVKVFDTSFRNVIFQNSKLVGVDFSKCSTSFFELHFLQSLVDTCNFSATKMTVSTLSDSTIRGCTFGETDLRKVIFQNCDLNGSAFHLAKLEKADFRTAKNYSINPASNKIKGALFSLPGAISLLHAFDIKLD